MATESLALIDVGPLLVDPTSPESRRVAQAIDHACRNVGFFRIVGHGIAPTLVHELMSAADAFFGQPEETKAAISMSKAGAAWRGWFPVGGELTSGKPDRKEGLYFGQEHGADHPAVLDDRPLHGQNLFPDSPAELKPLVLRWIEQTTFVGQAVLRGISLGLGLEPDWFDNHLADDPTILFRIFHYPPGDAGDWGVAAHTDYGLLTLLAQDAVGGLQVKTATGWIDVPPEPDVIVCNIGDMLDRLTEGRYVSTLHRVRNSTKLERYSLPLFLDPSWNASVPVLPLDGSPPAAELGRWDAANPLLWEGTYGDYLTTKVSKVFPDLFTEAQTKSQK